MMLAALEKPDLVDKLVVVDISPVNKEFDVTDATEWNMSHFFHAMLAVNFPQDVAISKARKAADEQLAKRISDPMLRAWLLMNMAEGEDGAVGWRINVRGILESFQIHIGELSVG